jgi:hypothetical protein
MNKDRIQSLRERSLSFHDIKSGFWRSVSPKTTAMQELMSIAQSLLADPRIEPMVFAGADAGLG